MKFNVEKNGKAAVLRLREKRLDATVSPELKAEFIVICKSKTTKKLILDLSEVQFCDSSGLSALLIADRTMRAHGGTVHLVRVNKKVLDLMKISQLDRLFTINATVADAVAS